MKNPLIDALETVRPLPDQDRQTVLSFFNERSYKRDAVLFNGGKVCKELYFIADGILRLGNTDDKGNDLTYFFLKEKQFCTILKSFRERIVAEERIIAACDTQVYAISYDQLSALYSKLPYIQHIIEDIQQRQLLEKIQIRNSFQGRDALSNYRALLHHFPDLLLRVSLKDIASYLGITPQSLSRLRKQAH